MTLTSLLHVFKYRILAKPYFGTKDVIVGQNVTFGKNVVFNCRRVRIGDGVIFQNNICINSDVFEIGDYGLVYSDCFFPGPGKLIIGHNFWLGNGSVIDSQAGTFIGNNVGIGAYSQLWTHMSFGDVLYGCVFDSHKNLRIEDDAWLVGHCLVSPVTIGARSLALPGSVITKDMMPDHTYAGVPIRDITEKFGRQFNVTALKERRDYLQKLIEDFAIRYQINDIAKHVKIVHDKSEMNDSCDPVTIFNVADRTYLKRQTEIERLLIRFLLPKAKFIPLDSQQKE